jgi:hypothetical protein
MSTVNKTSQAGQFNAQSMGTFNSLTPSFGNAVQQDITNPYNSMMFQQQFGMQRQQMAAGQMGQQQALMQRAQSMGISPNSPQYFAQLNNLQRNDMGQQAQGYNNLLLQAGQRRQQDLGMAGSYRPLQTGGTGTQTQSGTGSWLPQIAAAAMGAGSSAFANRNQNPFNYAGANASPMGNSGQGMQDVSGGAFGEGDQSMLNPNNMFDSGVSEPSSPWFIGQ